MIASGLALAVALALAAPAASQAAPPAALDCRLPPLADGPRPWRTGEQLEFELDVLGMVKTGTLQLSVEPPMSGGKIVSLRARAKTTAAVANIRKFAAVGLSWIDARTLLPERYRDEADENGVRKVSDTRIDAGVPQVTITYRFGERGGETVHPRAGEVLDPVSAIYYLRAARIAPGDRFCFDLVGNRRYWRLEGSVAPRTERVDTPAGRFETLRVDATLRRVGQGHKARPLHLWFSTDARRLLVAAVSEVDVGPVRGMLSSVRGARKP